MTPSLINCKLKVAPLTSSIHQWYFSRRFFSGDSDFSFSVWRGSCQTLSYIKVRGGSPVQRGHSHLNDLSKWTMVWLHRTKWCHICCHRLSLGSHTSMKRKKRKMCPLAHFTEKSRPGLQKSSSFFKHILFGWGGSRTLWPLWAPMIPAKASVRNWTATVDIPVLHLIFKPIPALDYSITCLIFSLYGKGRLLLQLVDTARTNHWISTPFITKSQTLNNNFQNAQRKAKLSNCKLPENLHGHHFVHVTASKYPSLGLTAAIYIKMSLPRVRVMQHLCWSELIEICNVVQRR